MGSIAADTDDTNKAAAAAAVPKPFIVMVSDQRNLREYVPWRYRDAAKIKLADRVSRVVAADREQA